MVKRVVDIDESVGSIPTEPTKISHCRDFLADDTAGGAVRRPPFYPWTQLPPKFYWVLSYRAQGTSKVKSLVLAIAG